MSYKYEETKPRLFTDDGQRLFLKIRDKVNDLCAKAGAVRMQEIMHECSGETWTIIACVDRMVELVELVEVPQSGYVAGQARIFQKPL